MRVFSTTISNLLSGDKIRFSVLVKLDLSSSYYLTDAPYDILFNGNTYSSNGGLISYDSPKYSSIVDREAYTINITDHNGTYRSEVQSGVVGKGVEVYGIIQNPSTNEYLTDPADAILVYKGKLDKANFFVDDIENIVSFECASPMANLDLVNTIITSRDGMDQISDTDTSFDSIYDDNEIIIKWGKT